MVDATPTSTYVDPNKDDKDKDKPAFSQMQTNAGPASSTAQAQPKGTTSGRFTNVTNYLKANQPGAGVAGKIATGIGGEQAKVGQQIDKERQKFESDVERGAQSWQGAYATPAQQTEQGSSPSDIPDKEVAPQPQQPQAYAGATPAMNSIINKAVSNPTSLTPEEITQYNTWRTAQYGGPQQMGDLGAVKAGMQNVQQMGQMAGSEAGRFGLLRSMFNKPTYSSGQQKLDQLLIQGSPEQMQQLKQARAGVGNLGTQLQTAQQKAEVLAQQKSQEAEAIRSGAAGALGGVKGAKEIEAQTSLAIEQGRTRDKVNTILTALGKGEITQDQAQELGISPELAAKASYLSPEELKELYSDKSGEEVAGGITQQNYLNQQQQQTLNALARLSGEKDKFATTEGSNTWQKLLPGSIQQQLAQRVQAQETAFNTDMAPHQQKETELDQALRQIGSMNIPQLGRQFDQSISDNKNAALQRADWIAGKIAQGEDVHPQDLNLVEWSKQYRQHLSGMENTKAAYKKSGGLTIK
jgi:hypothetical protein